MENFWIDRPVIVSGVTGFIGTNLAMALTRAKAKVIGIVLDNERGGTVFADHVVYGSVTDPNTFQRALMAARFGKTPVIFHLAAQAYVENGQDFPRETMETNVLGCINLMETLRVIPTVCIVASTDKVYGRSKVLPYKENHPLIGTKQIYEASKVCEDVITQAYRASYDIPVWVTRCGNVYGPYDYTLSRLIPGTIIEMLKGNQPIIRSDGTPVRDYIYVDDIVRGYMLLAIKAKQGFLGNHLAFNFGSENPVSVSEVFAEIRSCLGRNYKDVTPIFQDRARAEIHDQHLDWEVSKQVLGWSPSYTLHEGISHTIEWIKRDVL